MRRLALLLGLLLVAGALLAIADPTGPTVISNSTEQPAPASAASSTTAGGSFTTLVLNATTQSPRWKAYVGNVTGTFALRDASNATIYDWTPSSISGEVYSSRAGSVDWSTAACANETVITTEEGVLNHTATQADSINNTFNASVHATFYVGTTQITNSTCRAIATYVNSTAQASSENADFQEILLQDGSGTLFFAALINQNTQGYDNSQLDFQMIVPEDEYAATPHTYYFWLELS